ncbi:cip1-interacting zinc finger protein isoform X3 [Lissotriton helveticus]
MFLAAAASVPPESPSPSGDPDWSPERRTCDLTVWSEESAVENWSICAPDIRVMLPPQQPPAPQQPPPPQQQPQMMTLQATTRATILSPNPMLQQALFMQHMQGSMRGFAMGPSPAMPQFFTHSRHSMMRTPPAGISMKPPRLGFPGLSFQQQNRMFYKDYQRGFERKRELEAGSSQATGSGEKPMEKTDLEVPKAASEAEQGAISPAEPENQVESTSEDAPEPSAKRLKSLEEEGCDGEPCVGVSQEEEETDSPETGLDGLQQCQVDCLPNAQNISMDSKTEAPSSGSSLKVTIQQSSESRAISATAQKPAPRSSEGSTAVQPAPGAGTKFFCYICKANYPTLEQFQSHMATAQHLQRLQEIQHISNTCLVTFMPIAKESQFPVPGRDGRVKPQQRWCNACQLHFSGDLILHRRTPEHKLAKHSLRPFCTVCSRHFKTPRKFVEHMKSPEHKEKAREERVLEKEPGGPEDAEELITVDAVGCFEDDDDDEEDGTGEEENAEVLFEGEDCTTRKDGMKEKCFEDCEDNEEYCPDLVYGPDFMVPVAGYLCRLCHKFYPSDSAARIAHCKSLMHFQNVKKLRTEKSRAQQEASLCPQDPGSALEGDQSLEHGSQGPGEVEPWPPGDGSALGEDGKDMGETTATAGDSETEREHEEEGREEGAEAHETGDATLEEGEASATRQDLSPAVRRRSCRRKNR